VAGLEVRRETGKE
jgi:hypothetical protein